MDRRLRSFPRRPRTSSSYAHARSAVTRALASTASSRASWYALVSVSDHLLWDVCEAPAVGRGLRHHDYDDCTAGRVHVLLTATYPRRTRAAARAQGPSTDRALTTKTFRLISESHTFWAWPTLARIQTRSTSSLLWHPPLTSMASSLYSERESPLSPPPQATYRVTRGPDAPMVSASPLPCASIVTLRAEGSTLWCAPLRRLSYTVC